MDDAEQNELLLGAFVLPPAQAREKWVLWREGRDLDHLDPDSVQVLPLLAHRVAEWTADDPAKSIVQGVCKRAWTRNQMTLRRLAHAAAKLRAAGVDRIVLTGPASWSLLHAERKSIRPAGSPEILVARGHALRSARELSADGWRLAPGQPEPAGETLDHRHCVWLEDARGERLKLAWRLLPCPPELASSGERLGPLTSVSVQDAPLQLLGPEQMLLDILAGYRDRTPPDWRWDALALLAARSVEWRRLRGPLMDDQVASQRLLQLREQWRVPVPERILETSGWFRQRVAAVWRDYLWHSWRAGRRPSWLSFAAYCPRRWWKAFVTDRASA